MRVLKHCTSHCVVNVSKQTGGMAVPDQVSKIRHNVHIEQM